METGAVENKSKRKEPDVSVGIVDAQQIRFRLNAAYMAKGESVSGDQTIEYEDGAIRWNGSLYQELTFVPVEGMPSFTLYEVTIGVGFHWERKEAQTFRGSLRVIVNEGKLCAINILPVEEYLVSVTSSEMSGTAPLEFLKSQVVISRSWLMAQLRKRKKDHLGETFHSYKKTDKELVRWYDKEDHLLYDVCADDHCQRYQGITRASNPVVRQAVEATRGQVLQSDGKICDARFSKCCGGATEVFSTCWENVDFPYLPAKRDADPATELPDLTTEEGARAWIDGSPKAFCNTKNKRILSLILNNYDQETRDFFRWKVEYTTEELSALVDSKLKVTLGEIQNLVPLQRGPSGRICLLRIEGSEGTFTIGRELEIRRVLSPSHLLSSAFYVEKTDAGFVLHGAGWGHGVGLCQIGAAVMGEKGYLYEQILGNYYTGAEIVALY